MTNNNNNNDNNNNDDDNEIIITPETFQKIAALVGDKNTPTARPSTRAEKLRLYGLYKRATATATANTNSANQLSPRPGMFQIDARMKWDAWAEANATLTAEEARAAYVDLARELLEGGVVDEAMK